MQKTWNFQESEEHLVDDLRLNLGISNIVAKLLLIRGIKNSKEAKNFFSPDISFLHDPFLMKGMDLAVKRIERGIRSEEKILIYGDYDVDGTTSVSMMYSFLNRFSDNIGYYIPDRYEEGYGISFKGIDYAQLNNYTLIISLDCGTRAIKQVDYASNKAIDFIICDHHTPGVNLTRSVALLNPKQIGCKYPYKELSGCGVGFKLIQAISQKQQIEFTEIAEYMDLLAVSIGADIVHLTGENRILAFYGMLIINKSPRPGLKAIIEHLEFKQNISLSDVIFGVAPRINAAGRINHGEIAVKLLIEQDINHARQLSKNIEIYNFERKQLDKKITKEALSMVNINKKSTVLYSKKWHKGVIGIVASRVIEKHYKPTIILSESEDELVGSGRSVRGFNLYDALLHCEHLLEKFGGHKYAAGLTIKKSNLDAFINEFEKVVSKDINEDQLSPQLDIHAEIAINQIDYNLYNIIQKFAPFGPKNPTPIFATYVQRGASFVQKVGKDKSHLRMIIDNGEASISCIGFRMSEYIDKVINEKDFYMAYSIEENIWKGKKSLQIKLLDLKTNAEFKNKD